MTNTEAANRIAEINAALFRTKDLDRAEKLIEEFDRNAPAALAIEVEGRRHELRIAQRKAARV